MVFKTFFDAGIEFLGVFYRGLLGVVRFFGYFGCFLVGGVGCGDSGR